MVVDYGPLMARIIRAAAETIAENAQHLTELDQAIGDGDHGVNMKRGFAALSENADDLAAMPMGEALKKAGMTLVMKVGGASGPLYGSLLMAMGKAAEELKLIKPGDLAAMLDAGIEAIKTRGKSDVGAKTMLDVWVPVQRTLATAAEAGDDAAEIMRKVCAQADAALEATIPMKATKGRASFLGDRSIGHPDPGGASTRLLIHTICDVLQADG